MSPDRSADGGAAVRETALPGVGTRYDLVTREGEHVGVLAYRTGRRELFVYDRDDPDACREVLRLDADDSRTLAQLLGGATVVEGGAPTPLRADGFAIDWLPVSIASACAGETLADAVRPAAGAGGASVAAIIRGGAAIPTPPPDLRLEVGDVAVLIGAPAAIRTLMAALQRG
jgi:TrkA domain protein